MAQDRVEAVAMEEPTGVLGPAQTARNARLAHIRKFVCKPPERGHTLRLVAIEEPPTVLGEWPRVSCIDNTATAEDVDVMFRDHANTVGAEVTANLVWQSQEGLIVQTKRLVRRPEPGDGTNDPASIAQAEAAGLDGSRKANEIQLQREREAFVRSYFQAHQTQAAQYLQLAREQRELITTLATCLKEQYRETHSANLSLDKQRIQLRAELEEAQEEIRASANAQGEESGARAELIKMVTSAMGQALPFIVQQVGRMLQESAVANANAIPPQAAAAAE